MKSVVIALGGNNVVEDTISEYIAATRHGGIGICIQAYLLDSGKQLDRIIKAKGTASGMPTPENGILITENGLPVVVYVAWPHLANKVLYNIGE